MKKGTKMTLEQRKNVSEGHKGQIAWNKGKKYPQISGSKHYNWKGGKIFRSGYIYILKRKHPFADCAGYVKRSRLVMEKKLDRFLKPEERVHHKGIKYPLGSIENKQDDKIQNLKYFPNESKHQKFHQKLLHH